MTSKYQEESVRLRAIDLITGGYLRPDHQNLATFSFITLCAGILAISAFLTGYHVRVEIEQIKAQYQEQRQADQSTP